METPLIGRILAIDDDAEVHDLIENHIRPAGYSVEVASDGSEGLRRLTERSYSLILTGLTTTVEEDLRLFREMRQLQPSLRIVLFAPKLTPEEVLAAMAEHVFCCFRTPIEPRSVMGYLDRLAKFPGWRDGIEVVSARLDWIRLRVACTILTADRLVHFLDEFRADLPEDVRHNVGLAFREMLLNAIEHGGGLDPLKTVEVNAIHTRRAIVYHLRDPGAGFSVEHLTHAAGENDEEAPVAHYDVRESKGLRPGGFGILIARQLVDELIFSPLGNEVLLIKYLDSPDSTPA